MLSFPGFYKSFHFDLSWNDGLLEKIQEIVKQRAKWFHCESDNQI